MSQCKWLRVTVGSLVPALWLCLSTAEVTANGDMYENVDVLLDSGYAADAIYRNEVSRGSTIYNIVDAATQADPDREAEFRSLADFMVGEMPRSACAGNPYTPSHEWHEVVYDNLEPKSVEEAARLFFEDEQQFARLGDDRSHGRFPVAELARLIDEQSRWYRILPVRDHPVPGAVFVTLYLDEQEVVVDGNLGAVQEALDRGDDTIPVVFHYYREGVVPVGRFAGEQAGEQVIDVYASDSIRLSPVPNWKSGDYHTSISLAALEDIVDIPEKDDVDEELWAAIESDLLANGFLFPVVLQLAAGSEARVYNSIERVSVARELGQGSIPVTFFYQPPEEIDLNERCRRLVRKELVPVDLLAVNTLSGRSGNPGGPPIEPAPPPPPPVVPPHPPRPVPPPIVPIPPPSSP